MDPLKKQINVNSNTQLGKVTFNGYNTNTYYEAAKIISEVDGTPGVSDMPGLLDFYTTPDGSALPEIRMTIRQNGNVR